MRSDVLIRHEGFLALFDRLGPVEAERFIAMVRRYNFDYTTWRKGLWENQTVAELSDTAARYWERRK